MRSGILRAFSVCVLLSFLCGCGARATVPALIEPVAVGESWRPAEYGSVGDVQVLSATVMPQEYAHFYETNVTCDIKVQVGDHVKKGQVLAVADTEEASDTLDELNAQLAYENESYAAEHAIAELRIQSLREEGGSAQEIAAEQENESYDGKLHARRVEKLEASIAEQEQVAADGTLYARHSGYVTYIKNLAAGIEAGAHENIVVVADDTDLYLEAEGVSVSDYAYGDYEEKYIRISGSSCAVTELSYSAEELALAEAGGYSAYVRFTCDRMDELSPGGIWTLYFRESAAEGLLVGNDSLYTENGETFVYVRGEAGAKEKRVVTTGESGNSYTCVTDGLSENELVYYASQEQTPDAEGTGQAEISDFMLPNRGTSCTLASSVYTVLSDCAGTVKTIAVEERQKVKKGDLLCVIKSDTGRAALAEAKTAVTQAKEAHESELEQYRLQLKDAVGIQKKILLLQRKLAQLTYENTLRTLENEYRALAENNDGEGNISVYAPCAGKVRTLSVEEGDELSEDEMILLLTKSGEKLLLVSVEEPSAENVPQNIHADSVASPGAEITITTGEEEYTGRCVGRTVSSQNADRAYLYTDEDGSHLSYGTDSGNDGWSFYVKLDDADGYRSAKKGTAYFTYRCLQDVVTIPQEYLCEESTAAGSYFVWRVSDGQVFKQYVSVYEEDGQVQIADGKAAVLSGLREGDILVHRLLNN